MQVTSRFIPMRTVLICLILAAVLPHAVRAQGGAVRATVVDAGSGAPVVDAKVELVDGVHRLASTTTDSAGVFTLRSASGGDAVVVISRIGYATVRRGVQLKGRA